MDALTALLSGPRARDAFLQRSLLEPPWSLRILDRAPLTIVTVTAGSAWIGSDTGAQTHLRAGDTAIVRGPDAYTVADHPRTVPQVIVHPGQICETPNGRNLVAAMDLGVRTWGDSSTATTVMLTGTYEQVGEVGRRLVEALPALIVLPSESWSSPLVELLGVEITKDEPGQEVVLDRLLDLLTISALRTWLGQADADSTGWFRAHSDPSIGRALRLLHNDPARPWTLVELAAQVGLSRAALARRFQHLVGESPMAYLAGWRLALAADLLQSPETTVSGVARRVGYSSPFTFSAAYKRAYGVSPQVHRTSVTAATNRLPA